MGPLFKGQNPNRGGWRQATCLRPSGPVWDTQPPTPNLAETAQATLQVPELPQGNGWPRR